MHEFRSLLAPFRFKISDDETVTHVSKEVILGQTAPLFMITAGPCLYLIGHDVHWE